ncbi:hypothetical protein C8R48DRAFT_130412 [Suillus tomentosus]|nr:hypothetical protein C8R48DRAFT_130412 [Suillus tomentosus]
MSGLHCLNGLAMDASKEQVRATDPQYRNDLVRHIQYGSRGRPTTWNERSLSNMIEIAVGMKVKATFNVETDLDIANEARELPNALHIYMYFSCFNKNSESEKEAVTAVWLFRTIVLLWRPCTSRAHEMANTFQF